MEVALDNAQRYWLEHKRELRVGTSTADYPPFDKPGLVMLDEPTGNLDSHTAQGIQDLMLELSTSMRTAFLVVTHDMNLARQMDRVLHLQEGRLTTI